MLPRPERARLAGLAAWTAVVTVAFIRPLTSLILQAIQSDLHSYIPLVPFVVSSLLYRERTRRAVEYRTSIGGLGVSVGLGIVTLAAANSLRTTVSANDLMSLQTFAYLNLTAAGGFLFLGSAWMFRAAFPIAFALFMVPLPDAAVNGLEKRLVEASADVAALLFRVVGIPLLRDGATFSLPGIVFTVAQECSGIHSSWVLFITSIVTSNLFLSTTWHRVLVIAFVIPLGILRNAFRILVIGLLCVYVGPHMINSYVHEHGGPLFFALSLLPLFGLLLWLRRRERRSSSTTPSMSVGQST